jgi:hypothetical protein
MNIYIDPMNVPVWKLLLGLIVIGVGIAILYLGIEWIVRRSFARRHNESLEPKRADTSYM